MEFAAEAGRRALKGGACALVLLVLTACSPDPTDNATACRDFEQAFTAKAAGRMSNDEWVHHFTTERAVSTGRVRQAFRLDHIEPALIAQECSRIGVTLNLTKK